MWEKLALRALYISVDVDYNWQLEQTINNCNINFYPISYQLITYSQKRHVSISTLDRFLCLTKQIWLSTLIIAHSIQEIPILSWTINIWKKNSAFKALYPGNSPLFFKIHTNSHNIIHNPSSIDLAVSSSHNNTSSSSFQNDDLTK